MILGSGKNDNDKAHFLNSLFFLVSIDEFEETMIDRLTSSEHFDFDELRRSDRTIYSSQKKRGSANKK